MKKRWTRRRFLQTSLGTPLVMGADLRLGRSSASAQVGETTKSAPITFSRGQQETLRAAMDEIIPAADGMPAASAVGGEDYLIRLAAKTPSIRRDLEKSLAALDELSRKQFGNSFTSLSRPARVEALRTLEQQPPTENFARLRDLVYEAYYLQPQVWKLIGYEFHPTNQAGPLMKPFDEAVLANVRKMPKRYREVS